MTPQYRIEQYLAAINAAYLGETPLPEYPAEPAWRIERFLAAILSAAKGDSPVMVCPDPVWHIEEFGRAIYDAMTGASPAWPCPTATNNIEAILFAIYKMVADGTETEGITTSWDIEHWLLGSYEAAKEGGDTEETVTGTAPINLAAALAKPIISLTQYGLCTQADTPTLADPVDIYCNRGKLVAVDDELPDGYRRVLGFRCNNNAMWKIEGLKLRGSDTVSIGFSATAACNIFGCYQGADATDNYDLYVSTTSGSKYLRYGNGTYLSYWSADNLGRRFDVVFTPTGTSGMPQDSTWTEATFESANDLLIGATTLTGTSSKLKGDLYENIIVAGRAKLIPCERASDGVLGYYDTYSETFTGPSEGFDGAVSLGYDYSHCYVKVVGSPATPNLYDESRRVEGYQIAQDGTVSSDANYCYSAAIPVTAGGRVSLNAVSGENSHKIRIAFYTNNGSPSADNFVSAAESSYKPVGDLFEVINTAVPGTAMYARICVRKNDKNVMFNTGDKKGYVPFIEGEAVTVTGNAQNIVDESTNITGYYLNASGVATEGADAQYTDLIPVTAGRTYNWTLTSNRPNGGNNRWHGYKSDGTWKQQIAYKASGLGTGIPFELSATIPDGVAYVRLSYGINDEDVEFGQTVPQYATVEPLYAVGDVKDEQDIIPGNVTRRCAACVYDGTQPVGDTYMSTTGGKDVGAIIVYPRETPTTESVTPQPLETSDGTNIIDVTAEVSPITLKATYKKSRH